MCIRDRRYSSSKSHIQGTMNLCLNIFDSMKKVHGMGARERLLLQIAALLHDCGKYISMEKVSECSYQIIMSTDIIGLSFLERQMIACAVRFNNSAFVYYDELYSMGIAIDLSLIHIFIQYSQVKIIQFFKHTEIIQYSL